MFQNNWMGNNIFFITKDYIGKWITLVRVKLS